MRIDIKKQLLNFYYRPTHTWQYQHELLKYWATIESHPEHGCAYQKAVIEINQKKGETNA